MNPLDRIYREVNSRVNIAHELPDSNPDKQYQLGEDSAYTFVLGLVEELLEQEPQGLDEAAQEYAKRGYSSNAEPFDEIREYQIEKDAFKVGAKWMAEQFTKIDNPHPIDWFMTRDEKEYCHGYETDEMVPWPVEVYIKKKEE